MDPISIVVVATFALIAVAALASGVYWLVKAIATASSSFSAQRASARGVAAGTTEEGEEDEESDGDSESFFEKFSGVWRLLRRHARHAFEDDADEDDDDLPLQATTLLSALPLDSVIVSAGGEVLRSSPSAFGWGIVVNESVADARLVEAVATVFRTGATQKLDIVTHTAVKYVDDDIVPDDIASGEGDDLGEVGTVSRRNWLKITVAQLDASKAVILMEDVSEQRRFTRIRDAFIGNVTEQLLKPTKALEHLGDELESERLDQESLARYAEQVRFYSGNLNHLVSDLLLLLKAQEPITASAANRLEIKPLVERVAARLTTRAASRGQRLHVSVAEELSVNGQVDQLEGALTKLIENALDYSPAQAVVGVATAAAKEGDGVVIRVVDHGKGIPKADQPHIFERFWRGSNQEGRASEGTGLGLAIVKHVALTHHGSVSVWSAPGQGSTFSLSLPAAAED